MSFQGDLAGSGLADLLQSLARGKSGVLHLERGRNVRATFGFDGGALHLLPTEGEDVEQWRAHARAAWADYEDDLVEGVRMQEIARARRIQGLFEFLSTDSLHFRFAPGPVPREPKHSAIGAAESGLPSEGPPRNAVWVQPVSVEGLLLEHARLADEAGGTGLSWPNPGGALLFRLCDPAPGTDGDRLHRQCDGRSTLQELADRLGWPLNQARNVALHELSRGALRFASLEELFQAVTQEFDAGRVERAASRLRSWLFASPGGPLPEMDAHMLEACWERETLQQALLLLEPPLARRVLRRMDHALGRPVESLTRWSWYAGQRTHEHVTNVRLLSWQLRGSADPSVPAVRDMIVQARTLLGDNRSLGAAAILRIAAVRASDSSGVRLELGQCMIDAGLSSEAAPLILEILRPLVTDRRWDEALPLARLLCKACPEDREAKKILSRARARVMQRTLIPKRSLVWIAILGALGSAAVVQVTASRRFERRLEDVEKLAEDPAAALLALEQTFQGENDERVIVLRKELTERLSAIESRIRTEWLDGYKAAAVECTVGDVVVGVKRVLDLPRQPELRTSNEALPVVSDLFNGVIARMETLSGVNAALVDNPEQIRAEESALPLLSAIEDSLAGTKGDLVVNFAKRVTALRKRVQERGEERAAARARALERENLAQQDLLINTARAHEQAGDHARALETYRKLLESDTMGRLSNLLAREIGVVQDRCDAIAIARKLAEEGRQAEAYALLSEKVPNPEGWRLPWRVNSVPTGARVTLSDGTQRVTPFTIESAWSTAVEMRLEIANHESRSIKVEHPGDQEIVLSRLPERSWNAGGRVEAPPLGLGSDQIVCDRGGNVARLSANGKVAWQSSLGSLGGVGRAPVLLPGRPGHVLVLTEDGEAWVIDAANGERDGPWTLGAPPLQGPMLAPDGVRARFRNGELVVWNDSLEPSLLPPDAEGTTYEPQGGSDAGLSILRRRSTSATRHPSPWTPLEVEVTDSVYVVRALDRSIEPITIRREGEWTYVAWEAPNGSIPRGRLWISDVQGLRAYVP